MMRVSDDRGASAIFIAASMILLCGFVALAVDIGAGTDERRQDQIGADSSALGGSLELVISSQANPMQAAVNEIDALVETNLGRLIDEAAWNACTDPGALFYPVKSTPMFNVTTNESDCISLSQDRNTLRVRVPVQQVDTTFGALLGAATLPVSAFAEAARNTDFGGQSGAFPTGVLTNTTAGTELCVKTGPTGQESCGDPTTGDFWNFRPYFYEAVNNDPLAICISGEQTDPMSRAMADGIDHWFSIFNPGGTVWINGQWCQTAGLPGPPLPNHVDSAAGYNSGDISQGLVQGEVWFGAFDGRLERGPNVSGWGANVFEHDIDNRPLWDYIDDSLAMPKACSDAASYPAAPATTDDVKAALLLMKTCLFQATGVVIFLGSIGDSISIADSPRLAGAPRFWEPTPLPSNSCCYSIREFVPIWIEGLYARNDHQSFQCTGTFDPTDGTMCVHHPGMTGIMDVSPPGLEKVDSASALLLKCEQLPLAICQKIQNAGGPRVLQYDLQLTR